eukprot:TRINITY_DN1975_c0_g1_i2.p1 TRINITY_DN1975_c0_g1~~TRINITY_DN1975_c0_g1_i2.p1  ORF type:complete len:505 (+),score=43.12 TRINITY_DN1975_c0_g1_i2:95-1609(+)
MNAHGASQHARSALRPLAHSASPALSTGVQRVGPSPYDDPVKFAEALKENVPTQFSNNVPWTYGPAATMGGFPAHLMAEEADAFLQGMAHWMPPIPMQLQQQIVPLSADQKPKPKATLDPEELRSVIDRVHRSCKSPAGTRQPFTNINPVVPTTRRTPQPQRRGSSTVVHPKPWGARAPPKAARLPTQRTASTPRPSPRVQPRGSNPSPVHTSPSPPPTASEQQFYQAYYQQAFGLPQQEPSPRHPSPPHIPPPQPLPQLPVQQLAVQGQFSPGSYSPETTGAQHLPTPYQPPMQPVLQYAPLSPGYEVHTYASQTAQQQSLAAQSGYQAAPMNPEILRHSPELAHQTPSFPAESPTSGRTTPTLSSSTTQLRQRIESLTQRLQASTAQPAHSVSNDAYRKLYQQLASSGNQSPAHAIATGHAVAAVVVATACAAAAAGHCSAVSNSRANVCKSPPGATPKTASALTVHFPKSPEEDLAEREAWARQFMDRISRLRALMSDSGQ